MTGVEIAIGYLAVYAWRKGRRVAGRVDEQVDQVLDAGLDRLEHLVAAKLGTDPGLAQLRVEAVSDLDAVTVKARTSERVRLALLDAVETDPGFAAALEDLVAELQTTEQRSGTGATVVNVSGERAIGVGGDSSGINSTGEGAVNVQRR